MKMAPKEVLDLFSSDDVLWFSETLVLCFHSKAFIYMYINIYMKPTRIGIALGQHGRDGTLSERNCLGNVFVTVRDCTA